VGKVFYSDESYRRRQEKLKRRIGSAASRPLRSSSGAAGPPAPGHVEPTPAERKRIRAAQRDPDLTGFHRREYELQDETTYYSDPPVNPPRHDVRRPRTLTNDPDLQPDDEDFTPEDPEGLPRLGAVSATDAAIRSLDSLVAEVDHKLRSLEEMARSLLRKLEADTTGNDEATHAAEQMTYILGDALRPWLDQLGQELDAVINATPEGRIDRGEPPIENEGP
jgi:hypothetical protein